MWLEIFTTFLLTTKLCLYNINVAINSFFAWDFQNIFANVNLHIAIIIHICYYNIPFLIQKMRKNTTLMQSQTVKGRKKMQKNLVQLVKRRKRKKVFKTPKDESFLCEYEK